MTRALAPKYLMTKTYFVTASAYTHQNLFQRTETADLLLATIVRNRDKGEFDLHEFVIMPNHMHLLLTIDDDHSIGRAMQLIKGGFSHATFEAESGVAAQLLRASGS